MNLFYIYLLFIKYGLLSFGGGYVLVSLYVHDLIEKYHLLTENDFFNLLAISQMTPGPIGINTATYIGYITNGIIGSIIASYGLVTPAVFLVITSAFYFKKYEKNPFMQGVLFGIRPATLGLICSAILIFANRAIFSTPVTVSTVSSWIRHSDDVTSFGIRLLPLAIAIFAGTAVGRFKVNILYVIVAAAIIGALFIR